MSAPPSQVLSVENLAKSFGKLRAVDGVSFSVAPGEIVGLIGPNGAGKTTTINMILGVLEPTSGRIVIEGVDLRADRSAALARTNFAAVYAPAAGQSHRRAEPQASLPGSTMSKGSTRASRSCWRPMI